MGSRSRLRTQSVGRRRLVILVCILGILLAVLAWMEKDHTLLLLERVERKIRLGKEIQPVGLEVPRGTIYDRNYKEFAISYERVSVYANIREIEDVNQVISPLSTILEIPENDLYDRMGKGRLRVWLAKDISQDQEDQIKQLDFPGIHLHREYIRYYPQKESAAHLIGFVEHDTGLAGIEEYLNKLEARHRLMKDDMDDLLRMGDTRPGIDGRHLILTLDAKIQSILEDYVQRLTASMPGVRIGALVMEADSGALVGYAQLPSFDPNRYHGYAQVTAADLFNEKIAVPDPFKIFLRDVSLLESYNGPGVPPLPWSLIAENRKLGIQLQLWNRLGAEGRLDCDFISTDPIDRNGIPFVGDTEAKRDWETVPEMQTPLQLLTAVTRVINGGVEVTPHGASRFVLRKNQQEYLLEDLEKKKRTGLLEKGTLPQARELFRLLSRRGPLDSSMMEGESSSLIDTAGAGLLHHYLSMVAVPQDDPGLILLVTASGPGYQAGAAHQTSLSAEAFRIVGQIVALQQVMKNLTDMMSPREREEVNFRLAPGESDALMSEPVVNGSETEMASLVGMSLRKCLRLLQSFDVEIEIQGTGRVVSQDPPAGTKLKPGARVFLVLEKDEVDPGYRPPQPAEPE
jgi:cell division protein FtsI (penicillin-binding protein 3)